LIELASAVEVLALPTVSVPVPVLSAVTVKLVAPAGVVLCVVTASVKLLGVQVGVLQVTLPLGLKLPVTPDGRPEMVGVTVVLPLPVVVKVIAYVTEPPVPKVRAALWAPTTGVI
jgi:hypothetical protein